MQYKLDLALLAQVADVAVVQSVHMKLDQFKLVHTTRQDWQNQKTTLPYT